MSVRFGDLHSRGGYKLDEVASALQKSIRRGQMDDALFWASELDMSGYGQYCWKRLRIVCSEDVGPAVPEMPATIHALYQAWLDSKKGKEAPDPLYMAHAVILLARAKKSRIVDHAFIVHWEGPRPHREVPDFALDVHTSRGREMGRRTDHFFDEGTRLENAGDVDDPYMEAAREIRKRPHRSPGA